MELAERERERERERETGPMELVSSEDEGRGRHAAGGTGLKDDRSEGGAESEGGE